MGPNDKIINLADTPNLASSSRFLNGNLIPPNDVLLILYAANETHICCTDEAKTRRKINLETQHEMWIDYLNRLPENGAYMKSSLEAPRTKYRIEYQTKWTAE